MPCRWGEADAGAAATSSASAGAKGGRIGLGIPSHDPLGRQRAAATRRGVEVTGLRLAAVLAGGPLVPRLDSRAALGSGDSLERSATTPTIR